MQRRTRILEVNYLDSIFDNNNYESPEECAIRNIQSLPNKINIKEERKTDEEI